MYAIFCITNPTMIISISFHDEGYVTCIICTYHKISDSETPSYFRTRESRLPCRIIFVIQFLQIMFWRLGMDGDLLFLTADLLYLIPRRRKRDWER